MSTTAPVAEKTSYTIVGVTGDEGNCECCGRVCPKRRIAVQGPNGVRLLGSSCAAMAIHGKRKSSLIAGHVDQLAKEEATRQFLTRWPEKLEDAARIAKVRWARTILRIPGGVRLFCKDGTREDFFGNVPW